VIHDEATAPSVPEIANLARKPMPLASQQAMARTVDGVHFPNWARWGWTPIGGRTDRMEDGRIAATTLYTRDHDTIAYTLVSGTGDVNTVTGDRQIQREAHGKKVWLDVTGAAIFPPAGPYGRPIQEPQAPCAGRAGCRTTSFNVLTLRRHLDPATLVLTAWPVSTHLYEEFKTMALRTGTAGQ